MNKDKLIWWLVTLGESRGYDSYPVATRYFVAAHTEAEVRQLFERNLDEVRDIRPLPEFPSLQRKKKPFIFDPTPDVFVF